MSASDSFAGETLDSRCIGENVRIDLENYPIAGYHGQVRFGEGVIENRSLDIVRPGSRILNRPLLFKEKSSAPAPRRSFSSTYSVRSSLPRQCGMSKLSKRTRSAQVLQGPSELHELLYEG